MNKQKKEGLQAVAILLLFATGLSVFFWFTLPNQIVSRYIDSNIQGRAEINLLRGGASTDQQVRPFVPLKYEIMAVSNGRMQTKIVRALVTFALENGGLIDSVISFTVTEGLNFQERIIKIEGAIQ